MLENIHTVFSTLLVPGIVFAMGLCLFFITIPEQEGLKKYRVARKVMGCAYLIYCISLLMKEYSRSNDTNIMLLKCIIIAIALLQALMFTYTLITLIDIRPLKKILTCELILLFVPSIGMFSTYSVADENITNKAFTLYVAFYICQLARYIFLFSKHYKMYKVNLDNYYSNDEDRRLKWVVVAFYEALAIGILALAYALFTSLLTSTLFMALVAIFYSIFGIRFINYAFSFQLIEKAVIDSAEDISENTITTIEPTEGEQRIFEKLNEIINNKLLYKKNDLTIEETAVILGENHRTVSTAINHCTNSNFKTFINSYRINEATRLISQGWLNNHTMESLAQEAGFNNRMSFYRVFKKHTGKSPSDWHKES